IADEYYMSCFYNLYGFETVRLRYFNVYGERQNPNSTYAAVIPKFISNIIRDIPLTVNGDGEQCRDFVYAGDVARANLLACLTPGIAGQVFNIASEHPVTINDLAETLIKVSGKTVTVVHGAPLKGDIKYSRADITRAKNILGFAPKMTFEEGLRRTFASLSERLK
ncbi:MAG: NAD-dependent epimerase/dehydratase family protein, partial [Abditibacteriota bacterium]|nr:NAD-dependent epimerase/dehydratase family protein [Abditibacteriota bacterium]